MSAVTPRLEFTVLGPVRGSYGGRPLNLGPVLRQSVLMALLLRPDVTVGRRDLVERVWGAHPPDSDGVPGYVYQLRKSLNAAGIDAKSVVRTDPGGYRFVGAGVEVDSLRLDVLARQAAEAGHPAAAVEEYDRALALFEGEPLAGLPGPFAERERRRLVERRIGLVQGRADALIRLGRYDGAIEGLSASIAEFPASEPLTGLLMRALYGAGRQRDALDTWREFRARLIEELGLEPGEELRRLHESVLRGDDGALGIAPRRAPARRIRDELPNDIGELAGRESELALLTAPVTTAGVSVSAVDGVPGAGKTALVVRAAQLLREECSDGCLFVDLHGHRAGQSAMTPERALRRLLRSVGVDDKNLPDDLDELSANWRAATAGLRLSLVLDDATSAEQVSPLLPGGAGSRVLVTSRRRLTGLDVERRISLGPLASDAAAGLLSRLVGPARARGEQEAVRELARLCGRLPLALRIAGARLQNRPMWTFRDLVDRLADDADRLGELTAETRSVEAAFRLSYEQLPAAEQRAFRALGLAPTPELDRLLLAEMLDCRPREAGQLLENLVDANLVQAPSAGRYRLHDLVAVYARRLAEQEPGEVITAGLRLFVTACRAASEWSYPGCAAGPEPGMVRFKGIVDASAWLDEAGDLSEVVGYALAVGHPEYACWIAESAVDYLMRRGQFHECLVALELALSQVDDVPDRRMVTSVRYGLGWMRLALGDGARARMWMADGLRISRQTGDRREVARGLCGLGTVAMTTGPHDEAMRLLAEAAAMAAEVEDDWLAERAVSAIGYIHHRQGRHERSLECFAQSRMLADKVGSPAMLGRAQCYIGSVRLHLGQYAEAAEALREAAELGAEVDDTMLSIGSLTRLGTAEQELGNLDVALELQQRALAELSEQTAGLMEVEVRNRLGFCLLARGQHEPAREEFERVLALAEGGVLPEERARAQDGVTAAGKA
ncbi:AfsR/SARP family transcriptional regulator [Amycolatopsis sp.]|uniref:AfsR/SARP family transcriptional regulator n=1 Tax=Amycolatopsis sp. TaxID=37632 RepID=UPI002BA5CFEF|nr:BTAD domain-containing putative transcriptional regulator [Amycolatopsis sp.]HVV08446.1 BTAD domain-containing putative transcriptional regulator [Amycolatopsis sp.]